jgi:ribosomal protein L37AE/L43A
MLLSKFVYTKIAPNNYHHFKNLGYDISSTGGRGGKNTGQRIKVSTNHLKPNSNLKVSCRCDKCGKKYVIKYSKNQYICTKCTVRKVPITIKKKTNDVPIDFIKNANSMIKMRLCEFYNVSPSKIDRWLRLCNTVSAVKYDKKLIIEKSLELIKLRYTNSKIAKELNVPKHVVHQHLASANIKNTNFLSTTKTEFKKYAGKVHHETSKVYRENKHIINPNDHPRGRCGTPGAYQLDHIISIKTCFSENWPIEKVAAIENLQMLPWKDNRDKW